MSKRLTLCFSLLLCCTLLCTACVHNTPDGSAPPNDHSVDASDTDDDSTSIPEVYQTIIQAVTDAFPWNENDLDVIPEYPELSFLYFHHTELSDIGYAILDIDQNGQDELIIGDITYGTIYDIFTMKEGKAIHLLSGGEHVYYTLYQNGNFTCEWSNSAANSGYDFLTLKNGTLTLVERVCMDALHAYETGLISDLSEATGDNCWYTSTSDNTDDYKWLSYDDADAIIQSYQEHLPISITFTPLGE